MQTEVTASTKSKPLLLFVSDMLVQQICDAELRRGDYDIWYDQGKCERDETHNPIKRPSLNSVFMLVHRFERKDKE